MCAVVGCAVVLSEVANYLAWYWPPPAWFRDAMAPLADVRAHWPVALLAAVLAGPIAEEVIFRGVILRGLRTARPAAFAITVSAVLFAIAHLNPWQGLAAFCLGLLIGWTYVRTGSLSLCIAAHVLNNFLAMLSSMLPPWIPGMMGRPDGLVQFQPVWFTVTGAVVFAVATIVFVAKTRRMAAVI
jgi:membrane protease YdiL (CAAX protease family)